MGSCVGWAPPVINRVVIMGGGVADALSSQDLVTSFGSGICFHLTQKQTDCVCSAPRLNHCAPRLGL